MLTQSFWFRLWDLSAEKARPPLRQEPALCSRGEACRLVPGGAGRAAQEPGTREPPALPRPSVPVLGTFLHPNRMESFVRCFSII